MKRFRVFIDTAVAANVPSGEKQAPAILKYLLLALKWKPCVAAWDDKEEAPSKKAQAAYAFVGDSQGVTQTLEIHGKTSSMRNMHCADKYNALDE